MLGPAIDGGYYLLGVKQVHPRLFEDIAWSTSRLAAQTIDRAREISLHVHVLAPRYDVDDADTLSMLHGELAPSPLPRRLYGGADEFTGSQARFGRLARHTRSGGSGNMITARA